MATADYKIRPEIDTVLARLRSKIRTYVFLEGMAWVIVALGAVFWVTLGLNWAYFKVSNLELPVWFRMLIDVAAIAFIAGCLMLWLVQRLLKNMRAKALALVLERRFPELNDRLITAVEAAESASGQETAFTTTLRNRTIADVTEAARRLEVSDVFAKRPLRNAMLIAVVFIASIVGFGVMNQRALGYWYKAFFALQEEYWDRETLLVPRVISTADERIKPFREVDGEFVYKHPRGSDFTLSVIVPPQAESNGKDWVIPSEVEWDYELENRRGGAKLIMSKTGEGQFRQTVPNLIDGMTFTIRGNDYINRKPFRVVIVDPPNIRQMLLDCEYPDYTGLNPQFLPPPGELPSNVKIVDGSQISEPMETEILMQATTNKPLIGLRVEAQNFRLTVRGERQNEAGETEPATSKFELLAQDGVPMLELPLAKGFGERVLTAGEKSFKLPVKLATDAALQLTPRGLPLAGDLNRGLLLNPFLQVAEMAGWVSTPLESLPLPSNSVLRIFLEDTDDVFSSEPSQLTINGIVDQPPELNVACFGIGEYITPHAQIPVRGKITDDYGVAKARFEYQVTSQSGELLSGLEWTPVEFENPPANEPKVFVLRRDNGTAETAGEAFERFDVSKILFPDMAGPRGVRMGDVLNLTIYVEDGDNINGPHVVRQKPKPEYVFKIVSQDELLAILYQKELGLLSRFQQIITEVEAVEADLSKALTESEQLKTLRQDNPNLNIEDEEAFKTITATSTRSTQQAGKNQSETRAVEASWREIVDELGNNGIASPTMVESLQRDIIQPLKQIDDNDFPRLLDSLEQLKSIHASRQDSSEAIQKSHRAVQDMLVNLEKVLQAMQDLLGFHELTNRLKDIIQGTEAAKTQTEKEGLEQLNKLQLLD